MIFHAVPIEQNSLISSMSAINLHEVFHPGPTGPAIAIAYPYTLLVAEHMPYLGRPVITVEQQGHSTFARGLEPYLVTYIHIYLSYVSYKLYSAHSLALLAKHIQLPSIRFGG